MAFASRLLLLFFPLIISFAANSERTSEYLGKNLGQKLLTLEGMTDKNQALILVNSLSADKTLSTLNKLSILASKSKIYHQLSRLDKAIEVAQEEQQLAHKFDFYAIEADAYKRIGVYAYYKGNNVLALQSYQQALNYYLTINAPIAQANLYNNIALVHAATSKIESALASYQQALPLYQSFGSEKDKIDVQYNIAGLHLRLKRFDTAISMFHEVIEKRLELNDQIGLAMAYSDLGSSYRYAGDYQQAERYMTLALDFHHQNQDDYNAASTLHNLAELNNHKSNIEQAIKYAKEGIRLSVAQGHDNA